MKIRFNQPEKKNPENEQGIRIRYDPSKRTGATWRWYLILAVASLPLLYLAGLILREVLLTEIDGRIILPHTTVRAQGAGHVQQLQVSLLETVSEGNQLARLTNTSLENGVQRLHGEITFLSGQKKSLQRDGSQKQASRLTLFAQDQSQFYLRRLRQYESLFKQGAATQAEVATARSQYIAALERLDSLMLAGQQASTLGAEARQIEARINQLQLEHDILNDQLQMLSPISPAIGLVTEIHARPGEYLSQGQPLLDISFPEQAYISAFIPPKYIDKAVLGQRATIIFPNGEKYEARINFVPGVTHKVSAEDLTLLEVPRTAILARLQFIYTVDSSRLMNGMPVKIRFDTW
ncbi:MAG TPA: efflux RND transporter periplasmic adaptor subunit [Nitrosomonas mobilis]|nr:efflux RND transporter periplasmic adaptor subunit [Nitrosomonas mobilis]